MDITKEYIEMCKTDEIQELCNHDVGDFLCMMVNNGGVHVLSSKAVKVGEKAQYGVSIPRQKDIESICTEHRDNAENTMSAVFDEINFDLYSRWCYVWLPRQDQLQKMLSDSIREILFYNQIILDCWDSNSDEHMTMEQLWLWLVMDKKYNKVWNGKGWA